MQRRRSVERKQVQQSRANLSTRLCLTSSNRQSFHTFCTGRDKDRYLYRGLVSMGGAKVGPPTPRFFKKNCNLSM
jgi:hypothetical protein